MSEEIEEVQIDQQTKPVRKKSKKDRKPWRKRMRNVVLSPLHLFQKYVLRKKRRRQSKKSRESKNESIRAAAINSAKKRNLPCYFLFLGLSQSGKSTTISKLFNAKRPNSSSDSGSVRIYENSDVADGIGLKIVEAPGFSGEDFEKDEQIALSMSSFLNKDLSCKIPTVTFLVAPLDEEPEAHQQFTQMLKTLSLFKKSITDEHHSNLILLLTHSQKIEKIRTEAEIGKIIESYQEYLAALFPDAKVPIQVIPIENFRYSKDNSGENVMRYHDILFGGLLRLARNREDHALYHAVDWLSETSKRFSVPLNKENVPVTGNLKRISNDSADEQLTQDACQPYFVLYHRDHKPKSKGSTKDASGSEKIRTCIPAGSKLVLADSTVIDIEDCLVGDKLLSLDSTPTVITKIRREPLKEVVDAAVGTIYCSLQGEGDNAKEKLIYKYENGSFSTVDVAKANTPEKASAKTVYFIEADSANSIFVLNGFPCFVQCLN